MSDTPKNPGAGPEPGPTLEAPTITWGAPTARERGPLIGTVSSPEHRNVIGTHAGAYGLYRALAIAADTLSAGHRPDLTDTEPFAQIGPHPQWFEADRIVTLDPFGHMVGEVFAEDLAAGYNIQPTIAITRARMQLQEITGAMRAGRLIPDGEVLLESGHIMVTKAAIEPAWHLPGVAKRLGMEHEELRRALYDYTGGMYPELIERPDLEVLLPPIGGATVYIFGDVAAITDPARELTVRVHDECNGSDVFGSDICTCRPYLIHGTELCVRTAQQGGAGVIVYFRKEGRALGEVTKFLVYNARKRQQGGDRARTYFTRTECIAGVEDVRFQELMPDILSWLGITRIDQFVSMSNLKYNAVTSAGIEIVERVAIPDDLIPDDARVEIEAKKAAGYHTDGEVPDEETLDATLGRSWEDA